MSTKKLQIFGDFISKQEVEQKIATDLDVIGVLAEIGCITPVASENNEVYTDENGNIYIL